MAIFRQAPQRLGFLNRKRAAKFGWRGRRNCCRMTATPTTMGNTTNTRPMKIAPRTVGTRGRKRMPDHIPIPTKQTPTTKETGSKCAGLSTAALPRAYSREYVTHNPPADAQRMMDATRCPRYENRLASPTVTKNKMRMIDLILSPSDSIMRQVDCCKHTQVPRPRPDECNGDISPISGYQCLLAQIADIESHRTIRPRLL
jgi:hypothetical protein